MTKSQQEYIDYLKRVTRTTIQTLEQANRELLNQLVAKEYGLTEKEMNEVGEMLKGCVE